MRTKIASTKESSFRVLIEYLRSDWLANPANSKIRIALLSFRVASWSLKLPTPTRQIFIPVRVLHKVMIGWVLGMDIPPTARIGRGLRILHGTGLVVHDRSVVGDNCTLRHGVTLGVRGRTKGDDGPPNIGNFVNVGSGAQILGPITIGDGAQIGAGAVVLTDVPPGSTAVGNPARVLNRR